MSSAGWRWPYCHSKTSSAKIGAPFALLFPASEDPRELSMQQRQLRPGDILDDYCPRERRLTNHVVVAMIGDDIKQTRCTTCDADHEYKHARVPRQRKKSEAPAILSPVASAAPKRVVHDQHEADHVAGPVQQHEELLDEAVEETEQAEPVESPEEPVLAEAEQDDEQNEPPADEGPV